MNRHESLRRKKFFFLDSEIIKQIEFKSENDQGKSAFFTLAAVCRNKSQCTNKKIGYIELKMVLLE